jgi:hypothetical protein
MPKHKHPTYPDTETPILIGDIVVEPHGRNHDKGLYPYVVTAINDKMIALQSLIDDSVKNTYPCLVRLASKEEQQKLTDTMSPEAIDAWKRDMEAKGASILCIHDPNDANKSSYHLVIMPEGRDTKDFRVKDLIRGLVSERSLDDYTHDDVHAISVGELKQLYIIENLILKEPMIIEATPMTTLEKAYETLDNLERYGGMEEEDSNAIEDAFQELASKLGIELPERTHCDPYEDEYYYDD